VQLDRETKAKLMAIHIHNNTRGGISDVKVPITVYLLAGILGLVAIFAFAVLKWH
jgi:hypothetical protein